MQKATENLFRSSNVTGFLLLELLNFWFPWSSASLPWCKKLLTHRIYNPYQHFQEWCDIFAFLFACSYLKYKIKSWHSLHLPLTFWQPVETGRRIWLLLIIQRWITIKYMAKKNQEEIAKCLRFSAIYPLNGLHQIVTASASQTSLKQTWVLSACCNVQNTWVQHFPELPHHWTLESSLSPAYQEWHTASPSAFWKTTDPHSKNSVLSTEKKIQMSDHARQNHKSSR